MYFYGKLALINCTALSWWVDVETIFKHFFQFHTYAPTTVFLKLTFILYMSPLQCWRMKGPDVHCSYLRLQSPALIFVLYVVFYRCLLSSFLPTLCFSTNRTHLHMHNNNTQTRKAVLYFNQQKQIMTHNINIGAGECRPRQLQCMFRHLLSNILKSGHILLQN